MEEVSGDPAAELGRMYERWAEAGVRKSSPAYYELARSIASDPEIATLLRRLPGEKRQPNLVFGAVRYLGGPVGPYREFRSWLAENWDRVREVVLTRSTQTNEAARCAVLLPALAALEGPLALIEVGASAGLCLYPDRYSYRFRTPAGEVPLDPADGPSPVVIDCELRGNCEPPARLPTVVSRAGIDLNPLDASDAETERWLTALVWPEHELRRRRLRAALSIAHEDPPILERGDLLERTGDLIARAPADSRPVVLHSAVLAYLDADARERFVDYMLSRTDVTWIANEGALVIPRIVRDPRIAAEIGSVDPGLFLVSVDGVPRGWADQHGRSYEAIEDRTR